MNIIFKHSVEHDGNIEVQSSENNYDSLWIVLVDCDGEHKIAVRLDVNTTGNLAIVLSDWFDIASRRR